MREGKVMGMCLDEDCTVFGRATREVFEEAVLSCVKTWWRHSFIWPFWGTAWQVWGVLNQFVQVYRLRALSGRH